MPRRPLRIKRHAATIVSGVVCVGCVDRTAEDYMYGRGGREPERGWFWTKELRWERAVQRVSGCALWCDVLYAGDNVKAEHEAELASEPIITSVFSLYCNVEAVEAVRIASPSDSLRPLPQY